MENCGNAGGLVATNVTPNDLTYAWLGRITSVEKAEDGSRYVYGIATEDSLDSDEQIVDRAFAKRAMSDWYEIGNVRQMHSTQLAPAGKGILLESKPDGEYVRTKVVEPTAIKLVDEGVYTGYSVGISRPKIVRDAKAPGGRIVGGKIVEISLVDRPANPVAKFMLAKRAGGAMEFVGKSVLVPDMTKRSTEASVADELPTPEQEADTADKGAGADCPKCMGEGKIDGTDCGECGGSGHMTKAADPAVEKGVPPQFAKKPKKPAAGAAPPAKAPPAKAPPAKAPPAAAPAAPDAAGSAQDDAASADSDGDADGDTDAAPAPPEKPDAGAAPKRSKAEKKAAKLAKRLATEATKAAQADTEVPYVLRRLHDAVCAAYKTSDIYEVYPTLEQDGIGAAVSEATKSAVYTLLQEAVTKDAGSGEAASEVGALGKIYGAIGAFDPKGYEKAHERMHEAFVAVNKQSGEGGPALPHPSEDITPGQFRRPYITAGEQRETAQATPPRIPTTTHPVRASDFSRGPLTDGQERQLKQASLHDAITSWKPEVCRMQLQEFDGDGWAGAVRQPIEPFTSAVDARPEASPTVIPVGSTHPAPGEKSAVPNEWIADAIVKATAPLQKELKELRKQYEQLAAQPDPTRAALRGAAGNGAATVVATKVSHADEVQREAEQRSTRSEVEFLRSLARSGNPETRMSAEKRLVKLGVDLDD